MGDDDLVKRCEGCDNCPIEDMLLPEQKKKSVLKQPFPERHIHREIIEQICGRYYDFPCEMKYLIMRLSCHDRVAVQNACIAIARWDFGKKFQRPVSYDESARIWAQEMNLGRGVNENYAKRFADIWSVGLRGERQSISVLNMYETIIATPKTYEEGLKHYKNLKKEHSERDRCILKI